MLVPVALTASTSRRSPPPRLDRLHLGPQLASYLRLASQSDD